MTENLTERQKLMIALKEQDLNAASVILMNLEDAYYASRTVVGEFTKTTADIARRYPRYASLIFKAMDLGEVGRFDHHRDTRPKKRK